MTIPGMVSRLRRTSVSGPRPEACGEPRHPRVCRVRRVGVGGQLRGVGEVDDQRIERRAFLGREDPGDRRRVQGMGSEPVDRLGREGDQLAGPDERGRLADRGRVVAGEHPRRPVAWRPASAGSRPAADRGGSVRRRRAGRRRTAARVAAREPGRLPDGAEESRPQAVDGLVERPPTERSVAVQETAPTADRAGRTPRRRDRGPPNGRAGTNAAPEDRPRLGEDRRVGRTGEEAARTAADGRGRSRRRRAARRRRPGGRRCRARPPPMSPAGSSLVEATARISRPSSSLRRPDGVTARAKGRGARRDCHRCR